MDLSCANQIFADKGLIFLEKLHLSAAAASSWWLQCPRLFTPAEGLMSVGGLGGGVIAKKTNKEDRM